MEHQLEITRDLKINLITSFFKNFIHKYILPKLASLAGNNTYFLKPTVSETIYYHNSEDDMRTKIENCLNSMTFLQRSVFESKTFDKKNTALICKELNISKAIFWRLMSEARKKLIYALEL